VDTIEYRTADKSSWPRGPWDNEPDKKQWLDEATGYACLFVRNEQGALCGYVGVPKGHPWHGQDYDHISADAHGGLTFSAGCCHSDDPAEGVCHIPGEGEPDNVWWVGFDCAHCFDFIPGRMSLRNPMAGTFHDLYSVLENLVMPGDVETSYRDQAYIENEIVNLAKQAKNAEYAALTEAGRVAPRPQA
jgi:hypothetical protein